MCSCVRAATAKRFTVRLNNMVLANKMRSEQASGVRRRRSEVGLDLSTLRVLVTLSCHVSWRNVSLPVPVATCDPVLPMAKQGLPLSLC